MSQGRKVPASDGRRLVDQESRRESIHLRKNKRSEIKEGSYETNLVVSE